MAPSSIGNGLDKCTEKRPDCNKPFFYTPVLFPTGRSFPDRMNTEARQIGLETEIRCRRDGSSITVCLLAPWTLGQMICAVLDRYDQEVEGAHLIKARDVDPTPAWGGAALMVRADPAAWTNKVLGCVRVEAYAVALLPPGLAALVFEIRRVPV